MSERLDFYQVLGVLPNAEPPVIRAAYRALISIYHPDRNQSTDAIIRTKELNAAYAVLGDSAKRAEYDKSSEPTRTKANILEFEEKQPFQEDPLEKDWKVAIEFYPDVQKHHLDLEKISWRLAFTFKIKILQSQEFKDSQEIAAQLKHDYLCRYFGRNADIVIYAENIIKAREIEVALYLNNVIGVMGKSVDIRSIRANINNKFPSLARKLEGRRLFQQIFREPWNVGDAVAATQLISLHGGKVEQRVFSSKITLHLHDKTFKFNSSYDFCKFVKGEFSSKYA
ncbi:MAG: DnaJ domain-containing protein [Accumulibacter sp.]|jgi:hypothetical protein|uniref:J domain-containing protein n=1 Tax=Accumulibacter sp. TaxID=2053492 RepID=UPI002FC323EC